MQVAVSGLAGIVDEVEAGLPDIDLVGLLGCPLCEQEEPLLVDFELFDLFVDPTGTRIPRDQKSVALSLTYRAPDRTLTQDEVTEVHQRIRNRLVNRLGVTIRE